MPRLDGSGPMGQGAGTGRGLGPCEGIRQSLLSQGRGLRGGRGLGQRRNYLLNETNVNNKELLIARRDNLKTRLEEIEKEIEKL